MNVRRRLVLRLRDRIQILRVRNLHSYGRAMDFFQATVIRRLLWV